MNTFIESATSFKRQQAKESKERWKIALLATQQEQLKHFLGERDEEYLKVQNLSKATCRGNPLLRMNE